MDKRRRTPMYGVPFIWDAKKKGQLRMKEDLLRNILEDEKRNLRAEYDTTKKQLRQYDNFLDKHSRVYELIVLLGSTVGIFVGASVNNIILLILSAIFCIGSILAIFIVSARRGKKRQLQQRLIDIRAEAAEMQQKISGKENIYEIGSSRDVSQNKKSQPINSWVAGIFILAAIAVPVFLYNRDSRQQEQQANRDEIQKNQIQCLNSASENYKKNWNEADKDGDGSVSYSDGATTITTSYYDAAISCYRAYKTDDSDDYIADYQTKRQQEVDKYTTWLEASKQPTYVSTGSSGYRSSMSCTSDSIGSSTYTHCY